MSEATIDERSIDLDLCRRASTGDRAAFASLYERHFDGLYDHAYRTLRIADLAGDVVQDSFIKAWDSLQAKKIPDNPKAWLYTIARNAAIDEHRRRAKIADAPGSSEEGGPSSVDDALAMMPASEASNPELAALEAETAQIVWGAASALTPAEYTMLDLHVRRGFEADDIAEHLGLKKGAVYTRLSRLKDSLEESVGSMMLMRRGRSSCADLDSLLEGLGATTLTRDVHRAVLAHASTCAACAETRKGLLSPAALFGALGVVPAPFMLRKRVWEKIDQATRKPRPSVRSDRGGQPEKKLSRSAIVAAIVAMVVVVGGVTAVVASRGGSPKPKPAAPGTMAATDPFDAHSTSHKINVPSLDPTIDVVWTPVPKMLSYSVSWKQAPGDEPDTTPDVAATVGGATSPPLSPGRWYFALRTKGPDGDWTHTVHLGPYIIKAPRPPAPVVVPPPPPRTEPVASIPTTRTRTTAGRHRTTSTRPKRRPPAAGAPVLAGGAAAASPGIDSGGEQLPPPSSKKKPKLPATVIWGGEGATLGNAF